MCLKLYVFLLIFSGYINMKDNAGRKREGYKRKRRRVDEKAGTGEIDFRRLAHRPIARVSKVTY